MEPKHDDFRRGRKSHYESEEEEADNHDDDDYVPPSFGRGETMNTFSRHDLDDDAFVPSKTVAPKKARSHPDAGVKKRRRHKPGPTERARRRALLELSRTKWREKRRRHQ